MTDPIIDADRTIAAVDRYLGHETSNGSRFTDDENDEWLRANFTPKAPAPWPRRDTKLARLFWLTLLASGLAAIEAGLWLLRGSI